MEPITQPTSGGIVDTSGSAPNVNTNDSNLNGSTSGESPNKGNGYPEAFVDKLKKEKDNSRKEVHDLKTRLAEMEAKIQLSADNELEKTQQYKTLYEQEKEKNGTLNQDLSGVRTQITEARKRSSVKEELFKLGLNPAHEKTAFKLMDTSTVIIDTDTNAVIGSEDVAKTFFEQYKSLGMFGRTGPNVSHQAPTGQPTQKPISEMTTAEIKEHYRKISGT